MVRFFLGMEGCPLGQVLHGSATTTHAVQSARQRSQASLAQLSRELGSEEDQNTIKWIVFLTNPKMVAKWRKRAAVGDMKTRPTES